MQTILIIPVVPVRDETPVTIVTFTDWLANAKSREACRYYHGHLEFDLITDTGEIGLISDLVMEAHRESYVNLVQRRNGENFDYIAVRTSLGYDKAD